MPIFLAIVVDTMGYGLVYPILTALFTEPNSPILPVGASHHLRDFYLGLAYLLFPLCMLFGASFFGDLSDVYGRKKVLIFCVIGLFFSFLVMGIGISYNSLTLLMIGRAFNGLMAGSQPIAQAAIADMSTKQNKAKHMSYMVFVISIGIVIGPAIAGVFSDKSIISFFSYSTPFIVTAILSLVAVIWIVFGFHETFKRDRTKKISIFRPVLIFVEAFAHKSIRLLSFIFLLFQIGMGVYFSMSLVFLRMEFGYDSFKLGMFTAYLGVWFAAGLLLFMPILIRKLSLQAIATLGIFITGLAFLASSATRSELTFWLLAIVVAIADVIAYSTMMTIFSNQVDEKSQGWVMGIFGATVAIAWAIAGLMTNLVPELGASGLIAVGRILYILSTALMVIFSVVHKSK